MAYSNHMKQTYLFILGRQPELSLAELFGYAEGRKIDIEVLEVIESAAVISGDLPEPLLLMEDLAGAVKIARAELPLSKPVTIDEWVERLEPMLAASITSKQSLTFGLSFYGERKYCPSAKYQEKLALSLKRSLKTEIKHLRWVNGHGKPLSSVQVSKNKLDIPQGCELLIVCVDKKVTIGKTLAVQMFEDWSERDYGRPRRNARQGMLPPKLARMMVNMLGLPPQGILLDPFCGSGTVLMEAALLGWPKLIGADKSGQAIKDTEMNMKWLMARNPNKTTFAHSHECANDERIKLLVSAIEDLPRRLPPSSVSAIVTEPYLGAPLSSPPSEKTIDNIKIELAPLYNKILLAFDKLLTINGKAIFIVPRWVTVEGQEKFLSVSDLSWPRNPKQCSFRTAASVSSRRSLIYKREGQFVNREIVIVEMINR